MRKPKPLRPGDTVGIIAPSGVASDPAVADRAAERLRTLGFVPCVGESCRASYGYLAGTDEVRARDAQRMLEDPAIDGIWCMRGGYGVTRMLDRLDFSAFAERPKVVVGYSDITALHAALHKECGWVTFHGPMLSTDALTPGKFCTEHALRAVSDAAPLGELVNPDGEEMVTLSSGRAEGELCGGNLSLVVSLIGTRYEIDTCGKILFLEDVGEVTYRIDRMLTQLRTGGFLNACAGIVLGTFTDCLMERPERSLSLEQVFADILPKNKPILSNLRAGHCGPQLTLPLGARCVLDADARSVSFPESALA